MSVLGGYSYGIAKDNITVVENTEINGHVYGGLELLGITEFARVASARMLLMKPLWQQSTEEEELLTLQGQFKQLRLMSDSFILGNQLM